MRGANAFHPILLQICRWEEIGKLHVCPFDSSTSLSTKKSVSEESDSAVF
jgi:hypothetical protein